MSDAMIRKVIVEFLGTAILVYLAVGVATLMFGFKFAGGIVGALALWGTFSTSPLYSRWLTGLGTDGGEGAVLAAEGQQAR